MLIMIKCIPVSTSNRDILIQNEDLNALQTTGSMNDTLSDIMSVYMVI